MVRLCTFDVLRVTCCRVYVLRWSLVVPFMHVCSQWYFSVHSSHFLPCSLNVLRSSAVIEGTIMHTLDEFLVKSRVKVLCFSVVVNGTSAYIRLVFIEKSPPYFMPFGSNRRYNCVHYRVKMAEKPPPYVTPLGSNRKYPMYISVHRRIFFICARGISPGSRFLPRKVTPLSEKHVH